MMQHNNFFRWSLWLSPTIQNVCWHKEDHRITGLTTHKLTTVYYIQIMLNYFAKGSTIRVWLVLHNCYLKIINRLTWLVESKPSNQAITYFDIVLTGFFIKNKKDRDWLREMQLIRWCFVQLGLLLLGEEQDHHDAEKFVNRQKSSHRGEMEKSCPVIKTT